MAGEIKFKGFSVPRMKRIKVSLFCLSVAVFWVFAAGAASGVPTSADEKKGKSSSVVERGRAVYSNNCARCHGGDGRGHTSMGEMVEAPDLTDAAWQARRSTSRMLSSVANGRGGMPSFRKKLSKQEMAAAVAYVRTLKR
ncbi:MAG: cytochrome c6 [Acidobacteriota bacterium]|jgi:cytochrome c oxidase cbb3-type subunit 3|nr:cytochrome c6 [Acidobacteriota bacterium]